MVDGFEGTVAEDGVEPLEVVLLRHALVLLAEVPEPARHHLRDAAHGEPQGEAQEPRQEGEGEDPGGRDLDAEEVEGSLQDDAVEGDQDHHRDQ